MRDQCWHFCEECKKDWSHVVPDTAVLDVYFAPCPECVAKGVQIKPRVTNAVPESSAAPRRKELPPLGGEEGSTSRFPEALQEDETLWPEAMGEEGVPREVAYATEFSQSRLRVLPDGDVTCE